MELPEKEEEKDEKDMIQFHFTKYNLFHILPLEWLFFSKTLMNDINQKLNIIKLISKSFISNIAVNFH